MALALGCTALGDAVYAADKPNVLLERIESGVWQLDARQANMKRLLDMVAERTGSKLHYSWLPASEVTATCFGVDAATLLKCLFGDSVNMAIHDVPSASANSAGTAHEIWIMASTLANSKPTLNGQCEPSANSEASEATPKELEIANWLEQAHNKNSAQRLQAISELARLNALMDDASIRATLQKALNDGDIRIRLQAIGGIASREGELAVIEPLSQVLRSSSADFRLMALDYVETDQGLLQFAAQDADQSVRDLAVVKLELLAKQETAAR